MPKAILISITKRAPAEGRRHATVKAAALHAADGRPSTLTVAPPRPVLTRRPFADAFQALGLVLGGR